MGSGASNRFNVGDVLAVVPDNRGGLFAMEHLRDPDQRSVRGDPAERGVARWDRSAGPVRQVSRRRIHARYLGECPVRSQPSRYST